MRLTFGPWELDTGRRLLTRSGKAAPLSPKAFDLLALLIEHRPHPVSKPDIRARLWPDTFVSESNLPTLISEIRSALDDARRPERFIRTVHGVGYAFRAKAPAAAALISQQPEGWLVGSAAEVALFHGANVLGREGTDVILLKSNTVSRRHACITIDGDRVFVEDLGSKNGTYVNDERLASASREVADGDRIRIGSLLFTFRGGHATASTETQSDGSAERRSR